MNKMKGILLFNKLNDVIFISADEVTVEYINAQALKAGLIEEHEASNGLDPNIIIQLFSPLVASQSFMTGELQNPFNTIKCQNGIVYVFRQFSELTAMAIGSTEEGEDYLHRWLLVLHRLLVFFYGPLIEQVNGSYSNRKESWKFISDILDHWADLHEKEQCFLVEALERLTVNTTLNTNCISLLESALSTLKAAGDKNVGHALLFVNCKLMTLYSSRSSFVLDSTDILLMILLANTVFTRNQNPNEGSMSVALDDNMSEPAHQQRNQHVDDATGLYSNKSGVEYNSSSSDQKYKQKSLFNIDDDISSSEEPEENIEDSADSSARLLPTTNDLTTSSTDHKSLERSISFEDTEYQEWTVFEESNSKIPWNISGLKTSTDVHNHQESEQNHLSDRDIIQGSDTSHSNIDDINSVMCDPSQTGAKSAVVQENKDNVGHHSAQQNTCANYQSNGIDKLENCYRTFTVFLGTKQCQFTPATLHLLEVLPGITLVMVSELPKLAHAAGIVQALSSVEGLLSVMTGLPVVDSSPSTIVSRLQAGLKQISDIHKKYKGVALVEKLVQDINTKWDAAKKSGINTLKSKVPEERERIQMENLLVSLQSRLQELFRVLFLSPRKKSMMQQSLTQSITKILEQAHRQLKDYQDYLSIKAIRNVTLTSYVEEFPGLVHFIYVDRTCDYMTCPSLQLQSMPEGKKDLGQIVKQKVWQTVSWLQTKVASGYTTITARDSSFYYSYFLWFEDAMGNPLSVQQPFRGDPDNILPGILTGGFYRKLVRDCFPGTSQAKPVCCYELLCIHIGLVPTQYILSHCRKLATMLWEATDAPRPLSFL